MNEYLIVLNGCHEETQCKIKLSKEDLLTFLIIAKEINKHSSYSCEPSISVYEEFTEVLTEIEEIYDYNELDDMLARKGEKI